MQAEKTLEGYKRHQRLSAILDEFRLEETREETRQDQVATTEIVEATSDES